MRESSMPTDADRPRRLSGLETVAGPRAAAFDADGTLWRGDVSEDFTRWMIDRGHFDGRLWAPYEAVNAADPGEGCVKILEFYAGHDLARIRALVDEFWSTAPARDWIEPTVAVVRWLRDLGYTVLVVSGTPSVVLQPLVHHLPVEPGDILGLELEVDAAGCATGRPTGVPTIGPGKARRIAQRTAAPVLLAAGNSLLDLAMLRCSTLLTWAVDPDEALRAIALRENWWITDPWRERP